MIAFIQNNPIILLIAGLILAIVLILSLIKVINPPAKPKKEKVIVEKTEEKVGEDDDFEKFPLDLDDEDDEPVSKKDTEEEEDTSKEKKSKKKPKKEVEQVFKTKKSTEEVKTTDSNSTTDEIVKAQEVDLLDRMEFVKSTKTVSKLAKREKLEEIPESEFTPEELAELEELIRKQEIENEAKKSRYFNKSVRLANFSKTGDFDSMFVSHISDERTQVDSSRYLNLNEDFVNKLYARTYKTIQKSGVQLSLSEEEMSLSMEEDPFEEISDEEKQEQLAYLNVGSSDKYTDPYYDSKVDKGINLTTDNILIVDSVMHRKQNFGRKNNNRR